MPGFFFCALNSKSQASYILGKSVFGGWGS